MNRVQHVMLMAAYNRVMNDRIISAALSLPEAKQAEEKGAFFGSILGTFNHLIVADTLWLQRFSAHPAAYAMLADYRDAPLRYTRLDTPVFESLASLKVHRDGLDEQIAGWVAQISEADLDENLQYHNTQGELLQRNFFALLMHFFNHQTHHRGQATTLLAQEGVDAGVTDLVAMVPLA